MSGFVVDLIFKFFVAFGIVMGATFFGMLGAFIGNQPISVYVKPMVDNIKIWALVVALGGTIDPLRIVLRGDLPPVTKQLIVIIVAFLGAHLATVLIHWLMNWEGQ